MLILAVSRRRRFDKWRLGVEMTIMQVAATNFKRGFAAGVLASALMVASGFAHGQERLGTYSADPAKISISGISSGAFMANQFHIAHSTLIMGVGIVAGGLYACAVDGMDGEDLRVLVTLAAIPCMSYPAGLKNVGDYVRYVQEFADRGWIDSLEGLRGDRVYMFTGRLDRIINPETVHRAAQFYRSLGIPTEDLRLISDEGFLSSEISTIIFIDLNIRLCSLKLKGKAPCWACARHPLDPSNRVGLSPMLCGS